jgi:hypothetical protein
MTPRNYGKSLMCCGNIDSANAFVNGELVLEKLSARQLGDSLGNRSMPQSARAPGYGAVTPERRPRTNA